jgi:hypothetical protein
MLWRRSEGPPDPKWYWLSLFLVMAVAVDDVFDGNGLRRFTIVIVSVVAASEIYHRVIKKRKTSP